MANLPTTDGGGQNGQAIMTEGRPFPGSGMGMNNVLKYKARPDDMLLCAYPRSVFGTWFEYTKGWEQVMKENPNHPFLVMSYEAMKQDLLKEVRRISEFLGLKHTEDFLVEVVQKTEFDAMAARMAEVVKTAATDNERRGAQHACVKGVVGDWKNWFTIAQSEIFEEEFEREMSGTDALKLYSLKQ